MQFVIGGIKVDPTPLLEWLFSPTGLVTVLVTLLVLLVIAVIIGVVVYRAIRRRVPEGRKLLDLATTTWRQHSLPDGPRRELATLRSRLGSSLRETDRQLTESDSAGAPLGMLPDLARQLRSGADQLDGHLRRLENEPSDRQVQRELPTARAQVEKVCSAAASMREAARAAALEFSSAQLQELTRNAELEVEAVSSGTERLRDQ